MPDYRELFSRTLLEVMEEVFTAHGIDAIDEDTFDFIVLTTTRDHYFPILAECRRLTGQNSLDGFRPRW